MYRFVFLLVVTFHLTYGFVLKVKNESSDSSAPDHKVPPIEARLEASERIRRFEVKQRNDDGDDANDKDMRRDSKQTVHMINQAFDSLKQTIAKPEFRSSKAVPFIDKMLESLKDYVNEPEFRRSKTMKYIEKIIDIVKESANGPEYRTGGQANMRTDMVHLTNGQPSLVFELKPNFFVDVVKKVLSTQLVERFMDDMEHGQRKPKRYVSRYQQ